MDKFIATAIIAGLYVLIRLLEAKFIKHEKLHIKTVGRDSILVCLAAISGLYALDIIDKQNSTGTCHPTAYIDTPEF